MRNLFSLLIFAVATALAQESPAGTHFVAFPTTAKNQLPDEDDRIVTAKGKNSVLFFLGPGAIRVSMDAGDLPNARFEGSRAQDEFVSFSEQARSSNALTGFIERHPDSYVRAWLLGWHHFPLDTLRRFYGGFTSEARKSTSGRAVLADIRKKESVAVGRRAPAFQQNDKDGNGVVLKHNPVAKQYDVETLPANFLIDPGGRIVATDLNGEGLQKFLSGVL